MAIVGVKINGRDYHLACDDGQEEHLRLLADEVDDRVRGLTYRMQGSIGEVMGFLLTSITMADELLENKAEIERLSREVKRLSRMLENQNPSEISYSQDSVVTTLEELAQRIERIAERVEMR